MTHQPSLIPPGDTLALWENKIRTTGTWAHLRNNNGRQHYYIARNPSVETAISLCKTVIVPMSKLSYPMDEQKCLICALFMDQEQKEAVETILDRVSNSEEATQTQTQE